MRYFYAAATFRSDPILLGFPTAERRQEFIKLDATSEKAKALMTLKTEDDGMEFPVPISSFHDKAKVQKSWGENRSKHKRTGPFVKFFRVL